MTPDWSMDLVAGYRGQLGITDDSSRGAPEIRDKTDRIMGVAASGSP